MSCNLCAFSSLTAKRRYTLKSPALAFLKLNMYARDRTPNDGVPSGRAIHYTTALALNEVSKHWLYQIKLKQCDGRKGSSFQGMYTSK